MSSTIDLTLVIPVYNEAQSLHRFHDHVTSILSKLAQQRQLRFELLYVNDGSSDESYQVIRDFESSRDYQITSINFSRNFGKEAALAAGIDHCQGDAVLFMDADGQHSPDLLPEFIKRWQDDGDEVVYAYQEHREESRLKTSLVGIFYKLINAGSRFHIPENAADFKLLAPNALAAIRHFPERTRFFKGLSAWIGFQQSAIPYQPAKRIAGSTTWSTLKLIGFSSDGLVAFSTAPLRFITLMGIVIAIPSFLYGIWIILSKLFLGQAIPGYPSLITAVVFLGGAQLVLLGVLGEYIGHILSEVKARPTYVVREKTKHE